MVRVLVDHRCALDGLRRGVVSVLARNVVKQVASEADIGVKAEFSISFVGDEEMRFLNRDYRGLDRTTDVLSFAQFEGEGVCLPEEMSDMPVPVGDIVISLDAGRRQAEKMGHSLRREIAMLLVHGTLHLLGHDHTDRSSRGRREAREMRRLQEAHMQALEQCGIL